MVLWKALNKNKKNKGCDIFFASKILYNKGIMVMRTVQRGRKGVLRAFSERFVGRRQKIARKRGSKRP